MWRNESEKRQDVGYDDTDMTSVFEALASVIDDEEVCPHEGYCTVCEHRRLTGKIALKYLSEGKTTRRDFKQMALECVETTAEWVRKRMKEAAESN